MRVIALLLILCSTVMAEIKTEEVTYGENLKGYVAYDSEIEGERPAVLVVHEWWGHNDYARTRAEELAALGYVGFALDMYGEGKVAGHPDKAGEFSSSVMKNTDVLLGRFKEAIKKVKSMPQTDSENIGAIGYCFGGAVVLNMARAGEDLKGVASYHGSLDSIIKAEPGDIKARIAVFHGGADKLIPEEKVTAFKAEMDRLGADYEFIEYPGVAHSFTNKGADEKAEKFGLPLAYNAEADADSWARSKEFFKKIFK